MTPTLAVSSLSGAALLLSIFALCVALRTSARSQLKRLSALSTRLEAVESDMTSMQDELLKQLQRERARANMASLRARQKATEPGEQAASSNGSAAPGERTEAEKDAWQREANLRILRGEIKFPGR
jgi:hypothetical protein